LNSGRRTNIAPKVKSELINNFLYRIENPRQLWFLNITSPMSELIQVICLHNVETERFGDDIRIRGLTEKAIKELSIVER
jgi:hypothetical protein